MGVGSLAGCADRCELSADWRHADVMLWTPYNEHPRPLRRRRDQALALWSLEPREFCPMPWAGVAGVDLLMTYNLDANVPTAFLPAGFLDRAHALPVPTRDDFARRKSAVWISSNCLEATYNRTRIVEILQEHLPVDCLGRCLNNGTKLVGRAGDIAAQYKLWIAFDKVIDQDYVSEKFFNGVGSSLPVYIGSPAAQTFALGSPAYVDALQFATASDLGKYLRHLVNDYDAWSAYFTWRTQPVPPRLRALAERVDLAAPLCRLCDCVCNATCSARPTAGVGTHALRPPYTADWVNQMYIR